MRVNHTGLRQMATWLRYLLVLLPALLCMTPALATQTITYYHLNATGSPVAATDQTGALLWRETYQPYGGRTLNQAAASGNSHWYTGKPYDSAMGLSYFGARYYDPVVGRFMGVDPASFTAGNLQSFNRYASSNNNPYKYFDPDGAEALFFLSEPPLVLRPIIEALPRAAIESAPIRPQVTRPDFIRPEWGYNRMTKELHDRGYRLDSPTRNDKGLIYRNPETGEAFRIMEKPARHYRKDAPEKHENDFYWRHQEGPGKEWGPPNTIPNKSQSTRLREAPVVTDPCKGNPYCT